MITVAEQRRIYDQAVVLLSADAKRMDEARQAYDKASDAYQKARGFAEEAWNELVEVLKRAEDF